MAGAASTFACHIVVTGSNEPAFIGLLQERNFGKLIVGVAS
jgi:hypothetical protein